MAAAIGALARASMHKRVPALLRVHGDAVSFAWPPEILSPKPQHGWLLTGRVRRAAPRGRTVGIICEARANAGPGYCPSCGSRVRTWGWAGVGAVSELRQTCTFGMLDMGGRALSRGELPAEAVRSLQGAAAACTVGAWCSGRTTEGGRSTRTTKNILVGKPDALNAETSGWLANAKLKKRSWMNQSGKSKQKNCC